MELSPIEAAFVKHFGEMSSRWGINRTVGQIFAFLFVSKRFVSADDIVVALGCSRSNVSMGLKELESWRLVRLHHIAGDRREYFSTLDDVWDIVRVVADERRRREIDPTRALLREVLQEQPADEKDQATQARLREMYEVIDHVAVWSADVHELPTGRIVQLLKLGGRAARFLRLKGKLPTILAGGAGLGFGHDYRRFQQDAWLQSKTTGIL